MSRGTKVNILFLTSIPKPDSEIIYVLFSEIGLDNSMTLHICTIDIFG